MSLFDLVYIARRLYPWLWTTQLPPQKQPLLSFVHRYFFLFFGCTVVCGISFAQSWIEPSTWLWKLLSPNHWTAREVPLSLFLFKKIIYGCARSWLLQSGLLWLREVRALVAVHDLLVAVASCGGWLSSCSNGLSCPAAFGILPGLGIEPIFQHWFFTNKPSRSPFGSLLMSHQGAPPFFS